MYPFQKYIEQYALVVGIFTLTHSYQNITRAVCIALVLNIFLKMVHGFSILYGHVMHAEAIAHVYNVWIESHIAATSR